MKAFESFLRFVLDTISIILAALVGIWIGGQFRFLMTGERVQILNFEHTTSRGTTFRNAPVATKFYPAVLAAYLGKPRWLFAFLLGILTGSFVDDRFERLWLERVLEPLIVDRILKTRSDPNANRA